MSVVFGPVPVRRLGNCLFVDYVPPKCCNYSCTYCHSDRRPCHHLDRSALSDPEQVVKEVAARVAEPGPRISCVAIAADGEPTLDLHLGRIIEGLAALGKPVAVLSNGTLLTRDDVRAELGQADFVSLTFDAARPAAWQKVNAPHPGLRFDTMLQGFRVFAASYSGHLSTETMLIDGLNTSTSELEATADFISSLDPEVAFLAIPSGPQLTDELRPPNRATVERAAALFAERLRRIECLSVDVQNSADLTRGSGDGEAPFAARRFGFYGHGNSTVPLRPLAAGRPAAAIPVDAAISDSATSRCQSDRQRS